MRSSKCCVARWTWWKNGTETSRWYEDQGDGEAWKQGVYRDSTLHVEGAEGRITLTREWEGTWTPGYVTVQLTFCGIGSAEPELTVIIDGRETFALRGDDGRYRVAAPRDFRSATMEWPPVRVGRHHESSVEA